MTDKTETVEHDSDAVTNVDGDFFDSRYYVLNKRILSLNGQWPYQSTSVKTFRVVGSIAFCVTFLIPQARKAFLSWGDLNLFIECLAPLVSHIGCYLKLLNSILYIDRLRKALDEIKFNWDTTKNPAERRILRIYGEKGRVATVSYISLMFAIVTAWILSPLIPKVMDALAPLNHTRPPIVLFQTDYNVDPDEYFYPILLHGSVVCVVAVMMLVAIDTLYMAMAQHICAMFRIVRYRLENIQQENAQLADDMFDPDLRDDICYRQIVPCIKTHKRILRFVRLMESSNEWALVLVLGFSLVCMSVTLSMAVAENTSKQEATRFICYSIAQVVHLFCNTLPGHWIMNSSARVRDSAYSTRWYMMSRRSRGLVVLLLRRTATPCTIAAGRLYVMSMENFCSVLQTAMSYFTMLTSVQ